LLQPIFVTKPQLHLFLVTLLIINDSYKSDTWKNSGRTPRVPSWAEISPRQTARTIWSAPLPSQWLKEGDRRDYSEVFLLPLGGPNQLDQGTCRKNGKEWINFL